MNGLAVFVKLADDSEHTLTLTPLVLVGFERQFNKGLAKALDDQRFEQVYWLAWSCLKAAGVVVKPFGDGFFADLKEARLVADPSSESTETA
jgi:hypothetical protein